MNYIYDTLEVKYISDINESEYFILLEESDILFKTKNGYELNLIDYGSRTVYQKISDNEIKSLKGESIKVDSDRLVQRVKILDV